jgi:RND superfamily putative drug exporter
LIGILGGRIKPIQPKKARDPLKRPIPSLNAVLPKLTARAQRSPAAVTAWVVLGLLVLATPLLSANLGSSDARTLPKTAEARQLAEFAKQNFQHGHPDPVSVVVDLGSGAPGMVDYLNALNRLPGVAQLQLRFGVPAEGNVTVIDLTPSSENAAAGVVRAARAAKAPATAIVGGTAAEVVDYRDSVAGNLPLVLLVLLLATGSLLFLATGSLLIPVKALVMNLLTLAASLGVLIALFQWEWLFDSWGGIDLTTPVLLFVFIFGLSTDYEVFLLSRITEEWRRGADPDTAVRVGVTSTGPVVTTAAISLIIAGFMLGGLTAVKEIGTGMAVAILLDVTVVRGLLLPAVMSLLGRWNWWPRHSAPTPATQEELAAVS